MILLEKLKARRRKKEQLKKFRENLTLGQKVFINNGVTAFYGHILYVRPDRVKVMNTEMQTGAYPVKCIYPIED